MFRSHKRRGFTLIELAMGFAVAVVAAAIILPALQGSRQQARRTACRNNIKQIGLALHNYESAFKMFPPGWISSNHFSWQVMILPFVEQTNIYNQLNFLTEFDKQDKLLKKPIGTYRCPLDRGLEVAAGLGRSNMAGVIMGKPSNTTGTSTHGGGSFGVNTCHRIRDYLDGLSNTVMVGERMSTAKLRPSRDVEKGEEPEPETVRGTEGTWVGLNPGELSIVSSPELGRPNSNTYGAFGSPHGDGAFFVLGDGSVRFVSENINEKTFSAVCTIGGGEPFGDF